MEGGEIHSPGASSSRFEICDMNFVLFRICRGSPDIRCLGLVVVGYLGGILNSD